MMKPSLSHFIFLCVLAVASCKFIDEFQNSDDNCDGENKFQCLSGICIDSEKWCDGANDCDDGSDEFFCTTQAIDDLLCNVTHQYMCQDKSRCIRHNWLCNNVTDCLDGSDEANCTLEQIANATSCKGFRCNDGKCISMMWVCDNRDDCIDGADETEEVCRKSRFYINLVEDEWCAESVIHVNYRCVDAKYCVPEDMMCNGLDDCRDGSDEGPFCKDWTTMCTNSSCKDGATCYPDRSGQLCRCRPKTKYNYITNTCDDIDYCLVARPVCSQNCINRKHGKYSCSCEEGYKVNASACFATGPEALFFVSTPNEIKYYTLKSQQIFTVATDVKKAHGVTYDGSYVYWVETMEGHQAVTRAHLDDIAGTREVLLALGLENPGGIAVDHLGGNFYLTDSEKGVIIVCKTNGNMCSVVKTKARHPRFVTLDPSNGKMYWSDLQPTPVIMEARMDGSKPKFLVNTMKSYASGLAVDSPNKRLYYVDDIIRVVRLDDGKIHSLLERPSHPYGVAVFENSVYWSDWITNTIMRSNKLGFPRSLTKPMIKLDTHVTGIHVYHELLARRSPNPCADTRCSHFCFPTSSSTHQCGCPTGYRLVNDSCQPIPRYRPEYLIVSSGNNFTRVQLDVFSNPQTHATSFNIGYVQAMTMDSTDTLYIFDGQHKSINYIKMEDFTLGITQVLLSTGLDYIVDMDYDYSTHCLYWVDSGSRSIEVYSLQSRQRAILYRFTDGETPISLAVMVEYGKMMVAVLEDDLNDVVHIDSLGLDGSDRKHIIMKNLRGPHVMLRLSHNTGNVYIADEGDRIIDFVHPEGTKRQNFIYLPELVANLAIADSLVFWTGRHSNKLFWSNTLEVYPKTRRMELNLFPPTSMLHLTTTLPPPRSSSLYLSHPCLTNPPCSHICIQTPHSPSLTNSHTLPYTCLCPPNMKLVQNECVLRTECKENELYCQSSNECFPESGLCDGKNDCMHGEDEQDCKKNVAAVCGVREILCGGVCVDEHQGCTSQDNTTEEFKCNENEFKCVNESLCIDQSQRCNQHADCADESDEQFCSSHFCPAEGSFTCLSGDCIMDTWQCDGEEDCSDGSDEANCSKKSCGLGFFECSSGECVELRRRCDERADCRDRSDERACHQPIDQRVEVKEECAPWEYSCQLNQTICLPLAARCNGLVECPGATDELGCDSCQKYGQFLCKGPPSRCITRMHVCDGKPDCSDAADETAEACEFANSWLLSAHHYGAAAGDCGGYRCLRGECLEPQQLCDGTRDCFDDEGGLCSTPCANSTCKHICHSTPKGPQCFCHPGFTLAEDKQSCSDIDECMGDVCPQYCHNGVGTFFCSCYRGYALRSDHRSCKAMSGNNQLSVLYVSGNCVRSIAPDGGGALLYRDHTVAVTDLTCNIRKKKLYITAASSGKLIEVNDTKSSMVVTNIGKPTKVSIDWVTGNIYFVDSTPGNSFIRVCHVAKKKCARLQRIPDGHEVTAIAVDPSRSLIFYCVTRDLQSTVMSSSMSGSHIHDVTSARNCTGLVADSFLKRLFIAESTSFTRVGYDGTDRRTIISNVPNFESPIGLALFEDYIYFLVANSFKFNRCLLFGKKHCEPYYWRLFDANTFFLNHESTQRDDLVDECEEFECSNVCVGGSGGAECVCVDGSLAKNGKCTAANPSEMAMFNGWTQLDLEKASRVSWSLVITVCVMLVLYAVFFVYYHYYYKKRIDNSYMDVRFQNATSLEASIAPSIDIATAGRSSGREFSNPLQMIRDTWHASFNKRRPIGTAGLTIDIPPMQQQDLSDTESDLDERETKSIVRQRVP